MDDKNKYDVKMIEYLSFPHHVTAEELWKTIKKICKKYDCGTQTVAVYGFAKDLEMCPDQENGYRIFPKSIAVFAEYGGKGRVCAITLNYPENEMEK